MPFSIIRQDITKMQVDAIVNAANTDLAMGGGVCGAIFFAAGADQMQAACDALSPISTGEAVITPGFALPAKFVIHAAGPVYSAQNPKKSEALLASAYRQSLRLAAENGCESIAFPLISSGIYGYPKDEALRVATETIRAFLVENEMDVSLVVFDLAAFAASKALMGEVASYIDGHYFDVNTFRRRHFLQAEAHAFQEAEPPPMTETEDAAAKKCETKRRVNLNAVFSELEADEARQDRAEARPAQKPTAQASPKRLEDVIGNLDEPFSTTLLRLIDAKGYSDVEVYQRANLDRKLFSKIRTGKGYRPSLRTALALSVALRLDLQQTGDLLARAGYALSHCREFDVIVEYFIQSGQYDIFKINEVLFQYDQPLLGG